MELPQTKFQTSFVPKKPVVSSDVKVGIKKGSFFTLIATFIFIATLLGATGVFLWRKGVEQTIDTQIKNLEETRKRIDEKVISRATRLNERIYAVKELVDKHKSPSVIFTVLEDFTLRSVQYLQFSYKIDEKGSVLVGGNGLGVDYESIVLQSDALGKDGELRDLVFSSVQPNQNGLITFSFQAKIDSDQILYRKNLDSLLQQQEESENAPAPVQRPPNTTPATTTQNNNNNQ